MLSVYYDYQILFAQKYGGISRYFYELIPRLRNLGVECDISCFHNHNYYFAEELGTVDLSELAKRNRLLQSAEWRMSWIVNRIKSAIDTRRKHYDIIHPTYYYISHVKKAKIVLDIHDMIPEIYNWNSRLIKAKKKTLHEADRIISVSENTKRDLLEVYPDIEPERVSVIYRGTMMQLQPESSRKFARMNGRDYVLFVGSRGTYKNFARFFEAMKGIMTVHKDLCIFCAGGGEFSCDEQAMIKGWEDRVFQGGLTDDELIDAYSNALCFVFPSEYEGFGIPVLEAFACRCPLVCARATSLPEVADYAAEYFNPRDTDDMAAKILGVLGSEDLRNSLKTRGLERLKFFSWEKAARETLKCYEEALAQ